MRIPDERTARLASYRHFIHLIRQARLEGNRTLLAAARQNAATQRAHLIVGHRDRVTRP